MIMTTTNYVLQGYLIYLPIVLLLTFFVSRTLFKNGRLFMIDIFKGKEEIVLATNRLFELGFYLLNLGFALWVMEMYTISNYQSLLEILSKKIGGFSIYLGIMLFFNLFLFFRGRKKSRLPKSTLTPINPPNEFSENQ